MATKKKSPLADELRKAYKTYTNLATNARSAIANQTGLGAQAKKTVSNQTGLGAQAKKTVSNQTGLGAQAKKIVSTPIAKKASSIVKPATTQPTGVAAMSQRVPVRDSVQTAAPTTVNPKATTTPVAKPAQVAVPYETEAQIRARYANQYKDYEAQRNAEAERLRQQYNNQFNNAQRDSYIDYMRGRRELEGQLDRQGITGGMSETANLRDRLNYENRLAGMEGQRQSALQGVDNNVSDALYNYRTQADSNMNTELAENRQLRSEYEQNLREQNEERFVNTIGAYDTPAEVNAAIEAARANGETWKIPYLQQQSATLRQQGEAAAQAAQERMEETFVNTISRYDTTAKVDKAIEAARKKGETWKIPYLSQQKSALKQQGKATKQAEQERKEQRFVNNIGGYDTVEKVDKAIKAAKKNGESWKIPYLRQQKATIKQQGKTEKQARTERYEQRYANTISGWNSIDGINKEIKKIQKSGKNTWRIAYLRARRTELQNAEAAAAGGGGRSSGGGNGGGGKDTGKDNGKDNDKDNGKLTKEQAIKELQDRLGIDGNSKPNKKKKATKELKKKVKKSGGMLHMGNKKTTPARPYSLAGYQDGYRYVR